MRCLPDKVAQNVESFDWKLSAHTYNKELLWDKNL
jgi:hypothetical protein